MTLKKLHITLPEKTKAILRTIASSQDTTMQKFVLDTLNDKCLDYLEKHPELKGLFKIEN